MLYADGLCFMRNAAPLLTNISFRLTSGQLVKIIGNNGCGKTTLLKILCYLLPPDSGTVYWQDKPVPADADEYREQLLYIGHHTALAEELTPLENLRAAAGLRGRPPQMPFAEALTAAGLDASLQNRLCRHLSAGQKRRVALSGLQAFTTRLWLLDEPLAALDGEGRAMLTDWLQAHLQNGGMAICTMHRAQDWQVAHDLLINCNDT